MTYLSYGVDRSRGWISAGGWAGIDINDFPTLKKWEERMWARPAVKKGANVPDPYRMKEMLADKEEMEKHASAVGLTSNQMDLKEDCG